LPDMAAVRSDARVAAAKAGPVIGIRGANASVMPISFRNVDRRRIVVVRPNAPRSAMAAIMAAFG
jgi:hypothetical protein